MKVSLTPDRNLVRAARAALRALDRPGTQLNARWLTEGRAIFFQDTPAPAIVIKVYRQAAALEHEVAMMGRAATAGLPVPPRVSFHAGPPAVLITRKISGTPLSSAYPVSAEETGRFLRRLHSLGAAPPYSGGQSRWEDFVGWWTDRAINAVVRRDIITSSDGLRLQQQFAGLCSLLADRPCVLTRADFQAEHVLVDPAIQRVNAFLDFVDVQPSEPLIHIAVLTLWDAALTAPVLRGYGTGPVHPGDGIEQVWTLV